MILIKLTEVVTLLLVEYDLEKWHKNLAKDNVKCALHVSRDRSICGAMSVAL